MPLTSEQVTTPAECAQFQGSPSAAVGASTNVVFAGSVSVTVIVARDVDGPRFVTSSR